MYQLKLNDGNYIEKHIKAFTINHLDSNYNEYTNKTLITHEIAFDKFKLYYEALDTRKNTVENEGLSGSDNMKIASIKFKFAPLLINSSTYF